MLTLVTIASRDITCNRLYQIPATQTQVNYLTSKCGHWKYREHQKTIIYIENTKIRQHANASPKHFDIWNSFLCHH